MSGSKDKEIENDRRDIVKNGRRATDSVKSEEVLPSSGPSVSRNYIRSLFSGVLSLGVVTAIFTSGLGIGKHVSKVDSNVTTVSEVKKSVETLEKETETKFDIIIERMHASEKLQVKMMASIELNSKIHSGFLDQQEKSDNDFKEEIKGFRKDLNGKLNGVNYRLDRQNEKIHNLDRKMIIIQNGGKVSRIKKDKTNVKIAMVLD